MVIAFVNTPVSDAASLVAHMQKLQDEKQVRSYVVFQGGRNTKADIEKFAADKKISIPMAYLMGGENDPAWALYKLNPEAKNTVLVANSKRVTANFVNLEPKSYSTLTSAAEKMMSASE